MIVAEEKDKGFVTFSDLRSFLKFSIGDSAMLIYLFVASVTAACQIGITLWLKYWVLQTFEEQQRAFYPLILMGLILIFIFCCLVRESSIFGIVLSVTTNMYHKMCEKVLRTNILFFDSNPIGRILTRFSKDMVVLDLIVPSLSIMMTYGIFRAIAVTISLICVNYWMLIPIVISLIYLTYLLMRA